MKIYLKYVFSVALEKKGRLGLLLTTISLITALFIASLSTNSTVENVMTEQLRGIYGDYNISIQQKNLSREPLFDSKVLDSYEFNDSCKYIALKGESKDIDVVYYYFDKNDIKKLNTLKIIEGSKEIKESKGVYISENSAKLLEKKLGQYLDIEINNTIEKYKILGICEDKGILKNADNSTISLVTVEDDLIEKLKIKNNQYSAILLNVDRDEVDDFISNFYNNSDVKNLDISKTIDPQLIDEQINSLNITLYIMFLIILVMSTYIIYCTFKLIITDRLKAMGTLLSIGAKFRNISFLILLEGAIYGIIGGFIGLGLGVVITKVLAYLANPVPFNEINANIDNSYFILGIIFAILLSCVTASLPLIKLRKIEVKNIILNIDNKKANKSIKTLIIGILALVATLVIYIINPYIAYKGAVLEIILLFFSVLLLTNFIIDILSNILLIIIKKINIDIYLALNNIKNSIYIKSVTILFVISTITIIMFFSLKDSIKNEISGSYEKMNYDLTVDVQALYKKELEKKVEEISEIEKKYTISNMTGVLNGDKHSKLNLVGVDSNEYIDFDSYMAYENKESELKNLGDVENGIIISKQFAKANNISKSDNIKLTINDKTLEFEVLSIVDSKMFANGNYNIVNRDYIKRIFKNSTQDKFYIRTNDVNKVEKSLKSISNDLKIKIHTKSNEIKIQKEEIKPLESILTFISFLTLVIALVSCVSNIIISLIQREKDLCILLTSGMTTTQCFRMIIYENFIQTVFAFLLSGIAVYIVEKLLKHIYGFLEMSLSVDIPIYYLLISFIATFAIGIIVTIISMIKIKNMNLVEIIKNR
ncbi:ABC transporter permease [Paraclostridium bifermentans]|uniref:ABC transporter permease n=1 Tax=Paraclostridium bifermentans TaxID=1490 RepID=A0AA44IH94_PARBF|nr:ABC transporter permease [Paraclostridium bifermentans]MBN8046361.1 ABC transporter permease [Paraclostridium bifermentans]NME09593.1 ABC transporter permease [Paraclostridium bifermentans]